MSDTPSVMREFLFLDAKRKVAGLSSVEEQRWIDLGQLLKIEQPKPNLGRPLGHTAGYYAPDGNWYPYPAEPNSSAWIPPDWDAYRAAQRHTGFKGLTYPPDLAPPPSALEADPSQPTFGLSPPAGYNPPAQEPVSDALSPPPITMRAEDAPLLDAAPQADPSGVLEADPADVVLLDPGLVEPSTSVDQTRSPNFSIDAAFETDSAHPVAESAAPTNDLERSAEPPPPLLAPPPTLETLEPVAEPLDLANAPPGPSTIDWDVPPNFSIDAAFETDSAHPVAESAAPTNDLERSAKPPPPLLPPADSLGQPPVLNREPPLAEEADALDPGEANGAEPPLIDLMDSDADDSKVLSVEMVEIPTLGSLGSSNAPLVSEPMDQGSQLTSDQAQVPIPFEGSEQRIVVHLMDGRVKRGVARELSLMAEAIPMEVRAGGPTEEIPVEQVKAIFFMLAPGAERPAPHGEKIRVMFHDGREIVGYSSDFKSIDRGFFLVPADARSNTGKVYLFRWSVHGIHPM